MPENEVTIHVGGDLSQLEGDAKKLGSALDGAARGGIAGFEAAQQKVIDLTKRIAELRTALLQTNDPAAQAKLNTALAQSQKEFSAARGALRGMSLETREASEKAQMLAASLGIHLPMGLERLITKLPAVQGLLSAAFNASIVLAVGAAVVAILPKLDEWMDSLRGIEKASANVYAEVAKTNAALGAFGKVDSTAALRTQLRDVAGDIFRVKQHLESLTTLQWGPEKGHESPIMKFWNREEISLLEDQLKGLIATQKELGEKIPVTQVKEHTAAVTAAAKATKDWKEKQIQLRESIEAISNVGTFAIDQYRKQEQILKVLPSAIADQEFALKHLPPVIQEIFAKYDLMGEAALKAGKKQIEAAEKVKHQQEQLASSIESFIDRVFVQARSISDVFHQFLMQMLSSFVKWISQMLAGWLSGIKGLTGQGTGMGGGLFGSLLGSLFRGGSALSGAATGQTMTTGIEGAFTGSLPSGAIGVWGGGSSLTAASSAIPSAAGGSSTGMLGSLGSAGPPGWIAAAAMATYMTLKRAWTAGSPVTGAIGGMMTGDLSIAPFLGALLGSFGRGRLKNRAAGLEQGFETAANDLYDQFKKFKVDYESALSGLQALIAQGQQTLTSSGLGKWGRLGAENLARSIQQEIDAVKILQKHREANAAVMAGMTVPEFQLGGLVSSGNGGILALLHPGEFVMRQAAVDALGTSFLAGLNRAPRFDTGGAVGRGVSPAGGGQRTYNQTFQIYGSAGESPRTFAMRVAAAVRRATADGAL